MHLILLQMPSLDSDAQISNPGSSSQSTARHHPYFANPHLIQLRERSQQLGVAPSTRRVYQCGLKLFKAFCLKFHVSSLPASNLALQFFCVDSSQRVSHKTIGSNQAFSSRTRHGRPQQMVNCCNWSAGMQGEASCRTHLPITINIMCTLKMQLRSSASFSPAEKHLLWAAFMLAFYGFLRASELTSSSQMEFSPPGLHWCESTAQPSILTITLCQSKTDPFRSGHSISISLPTLLPVL